MKYWWQSKTVWVNALVAVASLLTLITGTYTLPPSVMPWITLALGIINIVLRFLTDQPIGTDTSLPPSEEMNAAK